MSPSRRLRAIAFAWACAACTSGVEQREQETVAQSVSSELASIRLLSKMVPIVEVTIDLGEPALFMLDTGATKSAVSPEQARRWEFEQFEIAPKKLWTSSRPIVIDRKARMSGIALGSWMVADLDVYILELPEFAGIVGLDILGQRGVLFDGLRNRVIVAPLADSPVESLRAAFPGRTWTALPLTIGRQGFLVEASIGTKPLRLFVDTGSMGTTLSSTLVRLLGARKTDSVTIVKQDAAGMREVESDVYHMPQFRLGPWAVDVEAVPMEESTDSEPGRDGVLGFDILGQVPFILDAGGGLLWILDPLEGASPLLSSSMDQFNATAFCDPLPMFRIWGATSAASLDSREWLHELAALLDDEVAEVREAAVESLSTIAGIEWSGPDRIDQAKEWCKAQPLEGADSPDRGD
jgi:predicted aspartyl protease